MTLSGAAVGVPLSHAIGGLRGGAVAVTVYRMPKVDEGDEATVAGEEFRGDACDDVRSNGFRQVLRANRLTHRWCRCRRCHCVLDDCPDLEQR